MGKHYVDLPLIPSALRSAASRSNLESVSPAPAKPATVFCGAHVWISMARCCCSPPVCRCTSVLRLRVLTDRTRAQSHVVINLHCSPAHCELYSRPFMALSCSRQCTVAYLAGQCKEHQ